jgi:hypothetical protein
MCGYIGLAGRIVVLTPKGDRMFTRSYKRVVLETIRNWLAAGGKIKRTA